MNKDDNQDLKYDFDFENQVAKDKTIDETETLDDDFFEEVTEDQASQDVQENDDKKTLNNVSENVEVLEEKEPVQEQTEEIKKIKILGKEFNFEDVVLILIGIVLIASIFLMPKIIDMFN